MSFSEGATLKTAWSYLDVLIAVGIVGFGLYWLLMQADAGGAIKKAVIYKDDAVIETIPLTEGEDRRIDLAPHGIAMVVEIRDQKIRVVSSSCKQQICVRKGWITHAHDPIICIPNKVTIVVTGTDPRYDAISR